jgi:class 3 adenylate cyclase
MSDAAPTPRPRISHAAVNYRPRIVGVGLCGAMLLSVAQHERPSVLLPLAVFAFLWPHLAYLFARAKPVNDGREKANVVIDAFLGGIASAALNLRLWPSTAISAMQVTNGLLYGGPRFLLLLILPGWALGFAAGWIFFGLTVHLESEAVPTAISVLAIFSYTAFVSATAYRLRRRQRQTRAALEREQAQSSTLLLNVFPRAIVPRLRDGEAPIADQFADVTVVFADIVGFTPLAERLGPKGTVLVLNELFAKFDQAAGRHGIEKIETTGDGYLAVGGAPSALDNHPEAAARFAIEIVQAARGTSAADGAPIQVRVGVHTGPVLAGVIGQSRFHYKVFGETVNVASRVQGECQAGRVLVSEATCKRIRGIFPLEEHAIVELKGHGPMRTYWLLSESAGVRQASSDSDAHSKRA